MTNRSAAKGAAMERLAIGYLREHLGAHLTLPRAGAEHDRGDIAGINNWTIEVKDRASLADAIRIGLADLAVEQANAATRHGGLIVKRHGVTDPARQLFVMELGNAVPVIRRTR